MADRYEDISRENFASGDWDARQHVRFLRAAGGASSGYTADLIEKLATALEGKDRWYEIDDPEHPAPSDGTHFLGWRASDNIPDPTGKIISYNINGVHETHAEEGWWTQSHGPHDWWPTHWRPLPLPPPPQSVRQDG